MISSLLDTILDRTVVGGYTSPGYRIRSRSWTADDLEDLEGKVVLITGATSGIGLAAAEGFARAGAAVRLLVRSEERGARARETIVARSSCRDVQIGICDLSSLASVRQYAASVGDREPVDVLVNNAGVLPRERAQSADGLELTFATNVVGPFLLTNLLVGALKRSPAARVINVSSGGMYGQRIHTDDLEMANEEYDGVVAYARAKRAQVILTEQWAERLAPFGIVVHAMHPGWVDTPGVETSLPRFHRVMGPLLRTPEQGADTILWLARAAEPGQSSGCFWHDRRKRPTHLVPWTRSDRGDAERLWIACEDASGWHDPALPGTVDAPP